MKVSLRERALSAAVIVPTAVVIIALAILQYRWSDQLSEATSVRLADSLQMSLINWHLDLFRDISEVCLAMRVDAESGARGDMNQYARRFAEWKAVTAYPGLVSGVYILRTGDGVHPTALRLDPSTPGFEPVEWPARFSVAQDALARPGPAGATAIHAKLNSRSDDPGGQFANGFYQIGDPLSGWRFEPDIPALFHPVESDISFEGRPAWIGIELNGSVIQNQILPDLAHRYFSGTDGLDYQVAVLAQNKPGGVIYSSDKGFGDGRVADPDGTMDLFGRFQDQAQGSPIHIFHAPSQNKGPAASVGISWFPLLRETAADSDWQLVVRHRRGGALGVFVTDARRRDLAISFGVLLLLVISMAMLIIASNRAQRLAKLQMDFVTAVSHELRTPLTVITSAADNIAHGVVEGKRQLAQYGSVIGSHARQLSGLVEQILHFAAAREGRQRYDIRPLEVVEVVETAIASTAGLIQAARFTVEREVDADLPRIEGDLLALSQCLQNLITNALKYGGEECWIGIRAQCIENGADGSEIQISVSDRGIGISAADIPHIFEPFYRSPSVATAQIHGTGLGLPLAKSIAEAMNGHLTVVSSPRRGSTFTLHLPCQPEKIRDAEFAATSVSPAQKLS